MKECTGLVLGCCLVLALNTPSDAADPPNIVLIVADDLGYGELGCFGQKKIKTPRLDQLAAEGLRLTQHYSGNAVCAPSRCVLMTGMHPGHATIRNNQEAKPEGQLPIKDADVTVAELLRERGYATGVFGKWGLGAPGSEGEPLQQGFDRFFGYNCQRHAHSYYPGYLWSDRERIPLDNHPPIDGHARLADQADPQDPRSYDRFKGTDYAPDRINEQVLAFVRAHKDQPFFLYYPTIIPHLALHVPDADLSPYLALGWQDPPFAKLKGGGYTPHFTPRAAYAAMISRMDMYVGRLLDLLEQLELVDNTIVIFSSDNGTSHVKREVDYEFFNSVRGLRGLKGSLHEGGVRVPTIVRWPGVIAAGTSSAYVSGFEDWLPTLAEVAGSSDDTFPNIDGISLMPTLRGERQEPRRFLYREFAGYGGQQSVRVGNWKAIRTQLNKLEDGQAPKTRLYNLEKDPGEQRDLADSHTEVLQQLTAIMEREHVDLVPR